MQKAIYLAVSTNKTQKEIAKQIGLDVTTVSKWKKHPDYNDAKLKIEREVLGDLTGLAIKTYRDLLLNGRSEQVKYLVAQDLLDRTGHKVTDKQEISIDEPIVLTNSWLDDAKKDN